MGLKHYILVGVDGSLESDGALAWAVAEAQVRATGLTVVHVCDAHAYGLWTTTRMLRAGLRDLTQPIVDDAIAKALALNAAIAVRGRVVLGSPVRSLLSLSSRADLVVVGRQGKGALASNVAGSVSQGLMARAQCPVVAVGPRAKGIDAEVVDRVVFAIGDRKTDGHALRSALAEAERRAVPMPAVDSWHVPEWPASGPRSAFAYPSFLARQEQRRLANLLAAWTRDRRPPLRVEGLGRPDCLVIDNRGTLRLSPRHSEIAVILLDHPEGLTGDQLAIELYPEDVHASTLRAEMTRLRTLLGPDVLESRPYRFRVPAEPDWGAVSALLAAGRVHDAVRAYRGPLLPQSDAPGVVDLRELIERHLRAAVLASREPDLMAAWTRSRWGADDLEMWQCQIAALPPASPLRAFAVAEASRLDRELSVVADAASSQRRCSVVASNLRTQSSPRLRAAYGGAR